jgi:uncharacterized protein (TIGR00369 family)
MNESAAREAFEQALGSYQQDFETFFLARLLGLEFFYTDDSCIIEMEVRDFMFNPQGSLHGGVVAMVMDISMGHLLKRKGGAGATLEMKTQFLKPVPVGRISVTGSWLHSGRSVQFLRSEVRTADDTLAAFATATWKALPKRG